MSRKPKKTTPRTAKQKAEADDAGVSRFINLAFRRAVEKTGKVVVVAMERRRCEEKNLAMAVISANKYEFRGIRSSGKLC